MSLPRPVFLVMTLAAVLARPALAQDAFGLEGGVSAGLSIDPLTGHSPWRVPGTRVQGGLYTGYASDPVYGCEVQEASGPCIRSEGAEPWVQDDWMIAGEVVGHTLNGRLSIGGGVRLRAGTGAGSGLPADLSGATSFEDAQLEDARISARWVLEPMRRWSVAPVASLRLDRETHLVADPLQPEDLSLGPLYGLGNGPGLAVPVGWSATRLPLALTVEPEAGVHVSSSETSVAAYELGLNPMKYWARTRVGVSYEPVEMTALLAEVEGRLREDALIDSAILGVEGRLGLRRSILEDRMSLTALVGHSPITGLGSPGFRGGVSLRWTDRPHRAVAGPTSPTPTGPILRLTVRDPDGVQVQPTVELDGAPASVVVETDGSLSVRIPDGDAHALTLRHPDHATLQQTIQAPDGSDWALERVLPLGGGDGIMVLDLRDPTGRALEAVDVRIASLPEGVEGTLPIDLGTICGDCGLTYSELPPGAHGLDLAAAGMAPGRASVQVGASPPSGAEGTLFLAPPVGQLDIRVVDEAGRAIPDAGLRLIGDTAGVSDVALDTSGGAMPVVTPGRWLVESTAPGRGRQLHQVEVQPMVPFSHSLAITLLPEIDAGTKLTVEVVDADGAPVSGALIFSDERLLATTGSSGLVTIEGLAAGEMSLRLEHPEFLPETARTVTLEPGTESSASFALGWLPGALVLRVTDADGRPSDSTVRLEGAGKTIIGRTGPDGLFSEVLSAGDWRARLVDSDRAPVGVDFEVVPGRNRQLAIQLVARVMPEVAEAAARLAVRVTDEGDVPVEGVRVQLGGQLLGTTSTEGTLRVAGLPLGEAMVEVNGEFFDRWTTQVALVSADDQVVDANLRSRLGQVVLIAIDPSEQPIEAQVRITGASGQTSLSRLGRDGRRSYRLAEGPWEFAFASERNGFGVEDLTVEREQAKYEVRWVGDQDGVASVLALPPKRPVEVQLWSLPGDAPTSGTLRMLGPDILPPFELGEDGVWRDALRVGQWEALATAPDLGIGGGELVVAPEAEQVSMRVELGVVEAELTAEEVTIDDALYFGKGSAELADRAQGSLAAVARTLRGSPSVRRVQIEGHADQSGSVEGNQSLSEARAQAVYAALLKLGVEAYRLETVGYGETRPVAVGAPDGAARSRRVVFRVVEVQEAVRLAPDQLSDGTAR